MGRKRCSKCRNRRLSPPRRSPRQIISTPLPPGELLKEELITPLGISQYRQAKETGVPAQRIGQIVLGRRSVTADTDLRLCRFFGLLDGYWLCAKAAYDTEATRRRLEPELKRIKPWNRAAAL